MTFQKVSHRVVIYKFSSAIFRIEREIMFEVVMRMHGVFLKGGIPYLTIFYIW